jgi:hypothetical protein
VSSGLDRVPVSESLAAEARLALKKAKNTAPAARRRGGFQYCSSLHPPMGSYCCRRGGDEWFSDPSGAESAFYTHMCGTWAFLARALKFFNLFQP